MSGNLASARSALIDLMQESQRAKFLAGPNGSADEPASLSRRLEDFVRSKSARIELPETGDLPSPRTAGQNGSGAGTGSWNGGVSGGGVKRSAEEMMMMGGGGVNLLASGLSGTAAAAGPIPFPFASPLSSTFLADYASDPSSAVEASERPVGLGDRPAGLSKRVIKATPKAAEHQQLFATEHNPERAELMGSFVRNPLPSQEAYNEISKRHGKPVEKVKTAFKNLRSKYRSVAISSTGQQLFDTVLSAFLAEIGNSPSYADTRAIADLTGVTHEEFTKALKEKCGKRG